MTPPGGPMGIQSGASTAMAGVANRGKTAQKRSMRLITHLLRCLPPTLACAIDSMHCVRDDGAIDFCSSGESIGVHRRRMDFALADVEWILRWRWRQLTARRAGRVVCRSRARARDGNDILSSRI